MESVALSGALSNPLASSCAFAPIALYNGERGFIRSRAVRLFFYAIYPLHMLALYAIRLQTIGY